MLKLSDVTNTSMEPTGLRKRHKDQHHNQSAHIDICSSVCGELVLVQFCELLIYRSSCDVFIMNYLKSDIHFFDDKLSNYHVIHDAVQTGSVLYLSLFIHYLTRFDQ